MKYEFKLHFLLTYKFFILTKLKVKLDSYQNMEACQIFFMLDLNIKYLH